MNCDIVDLRAPDPLGYRAPIKVNTAARRPDRCMSFGPFLTNINVSQPGIRGRFSPKWSRLVQAKTVRLDQKPRASIGLVQVVQVVQAIFNITHMCARAYLSFFSLLLLTLKFEFVRNHLDHLDQPNAGGTFRLDHPPGPPWTTRTSPMLARLSRVFMFRQWREKAVLGAEVERIPLQEASEKRLKWREI